MKYSEILTANKKLAETVIGPVFRIKVLSNIIIHQLKEILEFELRSSGLNTLVEIGNYDNISQDSSLIQSESNAVIVFWELSNLVDGYEYKTALSTEENQNESLSRVKGEIDLVLRNLEKAPFVLFNQFSASAFDHANLRESSLSRLAGDLNKYMEGLFNKNLCIVDLEKVFLSIGIAKAIDMRNYYSSKALYTVDFFRQYSQSIGNILLSISGKSKKVLVFDCDNTLWHGIVGEDGMEGIKMGSSTPQGKPFEAVQTMALKLAREGVIIGLCSKNNAEDVEEILEKHQDMVLRNEFITIKKINWKDKVTNLREIASELNIGLDSIVFVEDSDFEIGLVNKELPEVETFRVNEKSHLYPIDFARLTNRFYRLSETDEDRRRGALYKEQFQRDEERMKFTDMKDYLASLEIEIEIFSNEASLIPRMAQMTQKTNQFNLTTKRYSETEIAEIVKSDNDEIFALSVRDKYGDSGITGLSIVKNVKGDAEIDTFLLSCRIIGRGVEDEFMNWIVEHVQSPAIHAEFIATKKNTQVKEFYEKFGFEVTANESNTKRYSLKKENYRKQDTGHILLRNGRKA